MIGAAARAYASQFRTILILLCLYLPMALALAFVPADSCLYRSETPVFHWFTINIRTRNVISLPYESVVGILSTVGVAVVVEKAVLRQPVRWRDALRESGSRWLPVMQTEILYVVLSLGLMLLLVVPSIVFSVSAVFWLYAAALRRKKGREAIAYGRNLVAGRWWRTFFLAFGIGLLLGIPAASADFVLARIPVYAAAVFFRVAAERIIDAFGASIFAIWFLNSDYLRNAQNGPAGPVADTP